MLLRQISTLVARETKLGGLSSVHLAGPSVGAVQYASADRDFRRCKWKTLYYIILESIRNVSIHTK